ncbi:hypothetical protein BD770DRAFT_399673 [Pilaira anomala]|nr:hypothetical protein BD770DRAFT_399673 [Pilaira anomala]
MGSIRLEDNTETTGCLSSIFSSCSRPQQQQKQQYNEKFVYSAIEPMEQLPAYQDITKGMKKLDLKVDNEIEQTVDRAINEISEELRAISLDVKQKRKKERKKEKNL